MSDLRINAQLIATDARARLVANSGKGVCIYINSTDGFLKAAYPDGTTHIATVVGANITFPVAP